MDNEINFTQLFRFHTYLSWSTQLNAIQKLLLIAFHFSTNFIFLSSIINSTHFYSSSPNPIK